MSRDAALLLDIITAAKDAQDFVTGMGWEDFRRSRLHQNAVIRSLEIIGEASGKLTSAFREQHSEIAWSDIVGMRNRLIHDYGGVRLSVVWNVVSVTLETLVETIVPLIPPPDSA